MFKVNNKDIRTMPLMSLLLTVTYFTPCSSVCIVNFEQVNASWEFILKFHPRYTFDGTHVCKNSIG